MNCPSCGNENPDATIQCPFCGATLLHHAAWQIRDAQSRRRARQFRADRAASVVAFGRAVGESLDRLSWKRYLPLVLFAAGAWASVQLLRQYDFPVSRLNREGCRLVHWMPTTGPLLFLVSLQSNVQSSSFKGGALDTPLGSIVEDESGSLNVEKVSSTRPPETVRVQAREWIKNPTLNREEPMENIPMTDPSLAPGKIFLDREGTVLSRSGTRTTRLGRFLWMLMPSWPKGILQRGTQWQENVEWEETLGDWTVYWNGRLQWTLTGFQSCYQSACAHLTYQAELTPALRGIPEWARGLVWGSHFSGHGSGDVLYNVPQQMLIANAFSYQGDLTLPISDVSRIPIEQRVGRPVESQPGEIILHVQNKMDVRKP